ncbi:MAG: lysophospholipid acyltransferase family protein [Pseudomonadota bacterium]
MTARLKWALFHLVLYTLMGAMGGIGLVLLLRRAWTRDWLQFYARMAQRITRAFWGIEVEIRGEVPRGNVLLAAKHQSMFDVLILYATLPDPRFVMKRELLWAPVFGLYAWRAGCVPVDRRPRSGSAAKLVEAFQGVSGQIVVYPQGTRVRPGDHAPYRRGILRLAEATGWPVVPVATNAGQHWSRSGAMHGPGRVVISLLPELPVELQGPPLLEEIERRVEAETDRLLAEAR